MLPLDLGDEDIVTSMLIFRDVERTTIDVYEHEVFYVLLDQERTRVPSAVLGLAFFWHNICHCVN